MMNSIKDLRLKKIKFLLLFFPCLFLYSCGDQDGNLSQETENNITERTWSFIDKYTEKIIDEDRKSEEEKNKKLEQVFTGQDGVLSQDEYLKMEEYKRKSNLKDAEMALEMMNKFYDNIHDQADKFDKRSKKNE